MYDRYNKQTIEPFARSVISQLYDGSYSAYIQPHTRFIVHQKWQGFSEYDRIIK